ncbi:MAG: DUF3501 family protein [Myxococcales bacterium]|nr:DUF3501 family protein [Myxococcales bacterium]
MNPLSTNDLWPLPVYEGVREQFRREVIEAKKDRRVQVGPAMSFVFENRLTVKFQVQEILRIERIQDPAQVAEEVEGFNTMLPGEGELSATLMIELQGTDPEVKAALARLYGLRDHVWLETAGKRIQGFVEPGREEPGRVSAVQYVRFKVPDPQALVKGPAAIVIDHPAYSFRTELTEPVRRSLAQDLG